MHHNNELPANAKTMLRNLDFLGFDNYGQCIEAILTHSDFLTRWDFSDAPRRYVVELEQWKNTMQDFYRIRQVDLHGEFPTQILLNSKCQGYAYNRQVNHQSNSFTGEEYGYPVYPANNWSNITYRSRTHEQAPEHESSLFRIDAILCHIWGYQLVINHGKLCPPTKINFPIFATENNDPAPAFERMDTYINAFFYQPAGLPAYSNSND